MNNVEKIKFQYEDGCKIYRKGNMEFFARKISKHGFTLQVYEYFIDVFFNVRRIVTKKVEIPYEAPCKLDRIRERISEFECKNYPSLEENQ